MTSFDGNPVIHPDHDWSLAWKVTPHIEIEEPREEINNLMILEQTVRMTRYKLESKITEKRVQYQCGGCDR